VIRPTSLSTSDRKQGVKKSEEERPKAKLFPIIYSSITKYSVAIIKSTGIIVSMVKYNSALVLSMAVDEAAVKTETFADTGAGTMATAATEKGPMSVATKAAIAIVAIVASAAVITVLYIVTRDAPAQSSVVRMKSQFAMDIGVPSEPTLAPSVATSLAPSTLSLESAKTSLVAGIESPKKRPLPGTDVEGPTMIPPTAAPTSRPSTDASSEGVVVPATEQVPPTAKPATGPGVSPITSSQFDYNTGTSDLNLNSLSAAPFAMDREGRIVF
jgi:hypothetical protein